MAAQATPVKFVKLRLLCDFVAINTVAETSSSDLCFSPLASLAAFCVIKRVCPAYATAPNCHYSTSDSFCRSPAAFWEGGELFTNVVPFRKPHLISVNL